MAGAVLYNRDKINIQALCANMFLCACVSIHTSTQTHTHSDTHTHIHTHTHSLSLTHTHTHSLSLFHTHTHTHTHTYTHTHTHIVHILHLKRCPVSHFWTNHTWQHRGKLSKPLSNIDFDWKTSCLWAQITIIWPTAELDQYTGTSLPAQPQV